MYISHLLIPMTVFNGMLMDNVETNKCWRREAQDITANLPATEGDSKVNTNDKHSYIP